MEGLNTIEADILVWIQQHLRFSTGDIVSPWISALNNIGIISIITVLILLAIKKYRTVGITSFVSLLLEFILVNLIFKPIIERTRPYNFNTVLIPLGDVPTDYSFPSGHTAAGFAVGVVLLILMPKKVGIPGIVVGALIALSRLYNGVHYPTDVIGGLVIGTLTALLSVRFVYPLVCRKLKRQ